MINNDFNIVLDLSAIVWDKEDYFANQSDYFELTYQIRDLFGFIKEHWTRAMKQQLSGDTRPKIVLRGELRGDMINHFPFDLLPNEFYDFGEGVYSFLADTGSYFVEYDSVVTDGLISKPNLEKKHYTVKINQEVTYLSSKIHSENEQENIYFTFNYLWHGSSQLSTETCEKSNTYKTVISDKMSKGRGTEMSDFFAKLRPIFEHNKKHDCTKSKTRDAWGKRDTKKDFVSQLSAYRTKDDKKVQKILDKAVKNNVEYIGYDSENDTYVRFKCHKDNLFHGFDEYDKNNPDVIPVRIRAIFNK